MKNDKINTIYIGYDPKERTAYDVLHHTIDRCTNTSTEVKPLDVNVLRRMNQYWRKYTEENGQKIDSIDGRPFSTEFSFTRFLVPSLNMYRGWALYMDCDMYVRTDINDLFEEYNSDYYPLYCVKHDYNPTEESKMDDQSQARYPRKNWSSLMLFNCGHELNKRLTPEVVNSKDGTWLHRFQWLPDKEADIGTIKEEWNWLDGHSSETIKPKNVHFTTGGPWFKQWKMVPNREADGYYAQEWNQEYTYLVGHSLIEPLDD